MEDTHSSQTPSDSPSRYIVIGCGSAKRDAGNGPYPAEELYTSTYFAKKRFYAATVGDEWRILSAEYGIIAPDRELHPYDTRVGEFGDAERIDWAQDVLADLTEWLNSPLDAGVDVKLEVLAGSNYIEPLRDALLDMADDKSPLTVDFPFDKTSGIGEQMAWLSQQAAKRDSQQQTL
jgi:hypothetical protein